MPGRVRPRPDPTDRGVHQIGRASPAGLLSALERGLQLGGRRRPLALDSLARRQLHEVNVRIAQIHASVLAGRRHRAVVAVKSAAHGLVVEVVPNHVQHRHPVTRLRPQGAGLVHHRAIADRAHDLPIRHGQLGASGGAEAPAERVAGVPDPDLLVVPVAPVEVVVLVVAGMHLAHDHGVALQRLGHDEGQLVRMHRAQAEVAAHPAVEVVPHLRRHAAHLIPAVSAERAHALLRDPPLQRRVQIR